MIKQVITIQHKKFATGLFWQPVTTGVVPYLYARQLSDKAGKKYDLFVEYKSMIGLGDAHTGIRPGMPSAAALVTGALAGYISFLGVFQVDGGGFYLVAARNDVIIRDILVESEVEARKIYAELSNIPDWGALFAPASWGMPRSQEKFLADLVVNGVIEKLRQISMTKSIVTSVLIGVGFLILLGGFLYSPLMDMFTPKVDVKINPALMEKYQHKLEERQKELDEQFEIEKKRNDYPYNNLPDVMEHAKLCYKAIGFLMQPIIGWNQKSATCYDSYARVNFGRTFGTLDDFYKLGGDLLPGGVVSQTSNDEVSVEIKLPELKKGLSVDERDRATVARSILSIFQQIKLAGTVKKSSVLLKRQKSSEKLEFLEVVVNSKLTPQEFMRMFDGFDGVAIRSIRWLVSSSSWDYEIIVYTK